jgi:transposase
LDAFQLYDLLLNLDDNWRVVELKTNLRSHEVDIYVKYIGRQAEDPETGDMLPIYDHRENRRWRHLDTMDYKTYINCCVPRVKDSSGKVKTIRVPWADGFERFTYLFEKAVIDLLQATRNQTQTAALLDCGFNVINRIMHRATERGLLRRPQEFPVHHLCIDEKSFRKGHEYVTVLSHPHAGCILEVGLGRDKEGCEQLLNRALSEKQKAGVKTITMDMWKAYITTVKEQMPQAEITHDKFHLVKYLTDCIDKIRRREVKQHEELKNTRYVLLKNTANLTDKQRIKFEVIKAGNYEVCKAWHIRENFRFLFVERSKKEAYILFSRWCEDAIKAKLKEVSKVVEMFQNHLNGVLNAMVNNLTNAMAERLNGKIQEIKTVGRGYRRFENFRSAILFFHGGLNLYPQNSG